MEEKYIAAMLLAGVGDAMGYKCGDWEFCFDGEKIHEEVKELGGVKSLSIKKPAFIVSDDTVLLLSTAEALLKVGCDDSRENLYAELAHRYKHDFVKDMNGRAGGATTQRSCHALQPLRKNGWHLPFDPRGGGCGAAMRSMCIGLRYPNVFDVKCMESLIAVSVESGRMTHHHPTGYLGSFAASLFGAFSIAKIPLVKWGALLLAILPKVLIYVEREGREVGENKKAWSYFEDQWKNYLTSRDLIAGDGVSFPDNYDVKERDAFYKSLSFSGWGGSSGHDAPMIAYDALLYAKDDWITLCHHAMLHSGDNDSTGIIAGFCFGAMYGMEEVPSCNYQNVEYESRLRSSGKGLHVLANKDGFLAVPDLTDLMTTIDSLFTILT